MIIFFSGEETFLIQKRKRELAEAFLGKYANASKDVFDFEENFNFQTLHDSLVQGGGLFAEKRMVVIENSLSAKQEEKKRLVALLKNKTKDEETVVLIVAKEKYKKSDELVKFLEKNAKVEKYEKLKEGTLFLWIESEVKKRSFGKLIIERPASQRLVDICQGNLWQVDNEIDKLVAFKDSGQIGKAEVDTFVRGMEQVKIFDLVDAIGERNRSRAFNILAALKFQGENDFYIFSMILFQLRNLIKVDQARKKGFFSPESVAGELGIHAFVAKKTLRQLENFSSKELKSLFDLAAKIDIESKVGQQSMEEALDYFLAKL